jgi:hypothetical protein
MITSLADIIEYCNSIGGLNGYCNLIGGY